MSRWNEQIEAMGSHLDEIKSELGPKEPDFLNAYNQLLELAKEYPIDEVKIQQNIIQIYEKLPEVKDVLNRVKPDLFEPQQDLAPVQPILELPPKGPTPPVKEPQPQAIPQAQTPAQATPPVEIAQSKTESGLQIFKEILTAVLAVILVIFTLLMVNYTMGLAGDNTKISQAKDILMLLLGPFGTALGYYFGRLPADARAAQAQQQAAQTVAQAEQVNAKAIQVAEQAEELTGELEQAQGVRSRGATPAIESAQRLRAETRELLRLARRR